MSIWGLTNKVDKNKIIELYYHENLDQKAYVKNGINYSPEFMLEKAEKVCYYFSLSEKWIEWYDIAI
jgi:hypothetical protein